MKAGGSEKHVQAASADFEQQGFPVAASVAGKGGDAGWAVAPQTGKDHAAVFALEAPLDRDGPVTLTFTLEQSSQYAQHVLGKFRLSATSAKNPLGGPKLPDDVRAALAVTADKRSAPQRDLLADYYAHNVAPELAAERGQLAALKKQLAEIAPATVPIMRELPADQHRKTHIEIRGNYLALGDEVSEGVPAVFLPRKADMPHDRLALARWLVDCEQPADGARPGQSVLGADLRRSASCGPARSSARRASRRPSRIARLAGHGDGAAEVGREEVPQAARHVGDVSAVVARHAGAARARSGQSPAGPRPALPAERPRWSATRRWP